jgi:hypothetical protein
VGLPGAIHVKITTVFNEKENSASRNLQYLGGYGLNGLSGCTIGKGKHWNVNKSIMADTIELPDGTYKLAKKHIGPGHFDYKWTPIDNDDDEY